jgi:hypothetical protein
MCGNQRVSKRAMRLRMLADKSIDAKVRPERLILMIGRVWSDETREAHSANRAHRPKRCQKREIEPRVMRDDDAVADTLP